MKQNFENTFKSNFIIKVKTSNQYQHLSSCVMGAQWLGGSVLDSKLGIKVKRNIAKYPLHHVTYLCTKFEVATSNGLGGDTFTTRVQLRI